MSALRKEESLSTADIAGRQRATGPRNDAALDEEVGQDDRRPPRSAAVSNTATRNTEDRNPATDVDGVYDAEIQDGRIQSQSSLQRNARSWSNSGTTAGMSPPRSSVRASNAIGPFSTGYCLSRFRSVSYVSRWALAGWASQPKRCLSFCTRV